MPEKRIFVFSDVNEPYNLFYTYNVLPQSERGENTISIHRKKESNTLYTVNALNSLIRVLNNGVLDKTFEIDWHQFTNSFILTSDTGYRVVPLEFEHRISWN